jgi:5'-nucleotidase (lipoprotein e(P4) family)
MRRSLVLAALLVSGCATAVAPRRAPAPPSTPAPAPPAAPAPEAAERLSNDLHWARNSAEHRAAFLQTYALATRRLEEIAPGLEAGTWAVELDADETVIDNSPYQKERAAIGQGFSRESYRAWVERRAAAPLPGAVAFLSRVHEMGGKIAIVTNRDESECPATRDNFQAQQIPFDIMLCKPATTSEKEPRFQAVENGTAAPPLPPLRIVLYVGDNIRDFPDLDQDLRLGEDGGFEDFGTRFFILPNPMYGSWERNPPD